MAQKDISNQCIDEAAKLLAVQQHQQQQASCLAAQLHQDAQSLIQKRDTTAQDLDTLLLYADALCRERGIDPERLPPQSGEALLQEIDQTVPNTAGPLYATLETIDAAPGTTWAEYLANAESYAERYHVDLSGDVLERLLTQDQTAELAQRIKDDYLLKDAHCDRYDYMLAAFCGVTAGLVDSFFVGMPEDSKLQAWSDSLTDKFVIKAAKLLGWDPRDGNGSRIDLAIAFLENKFKVNYDFSSSAALGEAAKSVFDMNSRNHHIKSLAHSPDLVGLIFSLIEQFTGHIHFVDGGRMVTFDRDKQELQGGNFIAKLYAGICNWIGHCFSDVVGSSKTRGKGTGGRGAGLPVPGYELFQFLSFKLPKKQQTETMVVFGDLAVAVFENGYDARFGLTMRLPVLLNELLVRICFTIKRVFYHGYQLSESIPLDVRALRRQPELRRMLLVSSGTLCAVDAADAGLRSDGQLVTFFLHLNAPAWERFGFRCFAEIRQQFFSKGALDLIAMDEDLEKEWQRLAAGTE